MNKSSTLAFVAAPTLSSDVAGMVAKARPSRRRAQQEVSSDALSAGMPTVEPQIPEHVRARTELANNIAIGSASETKQRYGLAKLATTTFRYILNTALINALPAGKMDTWQGEHALRAKELFASQVEQFRKAVREATEHKERAAGTEVGYGKQLAKEQATKKAKAKANTYAGRLRDAIYAVADGSRDGLTGEPVAKEGEESTGAKAKTTREHRKAEVTTYGKLKASLREHVLAWLAEYATADREDLAKVNGDGTFDAVVSLAIAADLKAAVGE